MEDVFITAIHINKVRHLENLDIALSKDARRHLILTGKNGSGKTTFLEEVRTYLAAPKDSRPPLFYHKNSRVDFSGDQKTLAPMINSDEIILVYFAAPRHLSLDKPIGPKKIELQKGMKVKDQSAGSQFLQYLVNTEMKSLNAWKNNEVAITNDIRDWFKALEKAFQEIFEDETLKLEFVFDDFNFYLIRKNRERVDLTQLADGHSAILSIIFELMMRMGEHLSFNYETSGFVLIDEIETHLHVSLQKKILPFLTALFPKIQFIVSTHSPFVLNSLSNAVIYDLENRVRVENLSTVAYDAIVENYFDVDKYSDRVKQMVDQYKNLLQKNDKSSEEQYELFKLGQQLKKFPRDFAPELFGFLQTLDLKHHGGEQ